MDTEPLPRSLQSFTLVLSRFKILAKSLFSGLSTPKKILARNEVEKFATLHTFSSVAWNIHTADLCYGSLQASFSGKGKQSWPSFAQGKIDVLQAKSNIELRYAINLARGYSIECLVRVTQPPAFSQILGTS